MDRSRKRVLAVSSGGGHWVQLLRVRRAFTQQDMVFVTVSESYRADVTPARFYSVHDATRWNKLGLVRIALKLVWILARERPDVVVSTGAAPGYFALRLGKWFGARTVWIDSVANVEELSLSGRHVGKHADLWLTQWPHLARPEGPFFMGGVV
jgi:UDP-N-acetylglucosamine:LPS N-acetylglucosamine transferase